MEKKRPVQWLFLAIDMVDIKIKQWSKRKRCCQSKGHDCHCQAVNSSRQLSVSEKQAQKAKKDASQQPVDLPVIFFLQQKEDQEKSNTDPRCGDEMNE